MVESLRMCGRPAYRSSALVLTFTVLAALCACTPPPTPVATSSTLPGPVVSGGVTTMQPSPAPDLPVPGAQSDSRTQVREQLAELVTALGVVTDQRRSGTVPCDFQTMTSVADGWAWTETVWLQSTDEQLAAFRAAAAADYPAQGWRVVHRDYPDSENWTLYREPLGVDLEVSADQPGRASLSVHGVCLDTEH